MKRAKPSFSHRWVHHEGVVRFPNHIWAISWAVVRAERMHALSVDDAGSTRRRELRYVTIPQFSIAPAAKSGIASKSHLGSESE